MDFERLNQEIIACRKCPRLVQWREQVARTKRRAYLDWVYWGKPVPGFGDRKARILVVGLAPGAHGSNRTGRMFTGDASGNFLYAALHREGFANQPVSTDRDDGLRLKEVYISAVCRCVPPDNKPAIDEMENCQAYLETEIHLLQPRVIVCLGRVAFERILRMYSAQRAGYKFGHGLFYKLDSGVWVLCSYHPSRQNTQTGRLTVRMFNQVWAKARKLLETSDD